MRFRRLVVSLAAAVLVVAARHVAAGPQVVALFPLRNLAGPEMGPLVPLFTRHLAEKLSDRFDVRVARNSEEDEAARRRARALGATYLVTGALYRIGGTAALDLSIAPVEEPRAARTVVAEVAWAEAPGNGGTDLPPSGRRLVLEASARLRYVFLGDEVVGEKDRRIRIPRPKGVLARSRALPGEVVSAAFGDVDGDGVPEVVAALGDEILVCRAQGEELSVKARIPVPGGGVVRVDLASAGGNGKPDIVIARYAAGRAFSDIVAFREGTYRRMAADLPWFLRPLGQAQGAGSELAGQESSPAAVFTGPVFRVDCVRRGEGLECARKDPLPLPPGTSLFAFVPLRGWGASAYAVVGPEGRVRLVDSDGRVTAETIDRVVGTNRYIEAPAGGGATPVGVPLPPRLVAADLDGDGTDEILAINNLAAAGLFFEGLRLFQEAEAVCFVREGDGVRLAWRTPQIGAPAWDFFLETGVKGEGFEGIGIASSEPKKVLDRLGEWRIIRVR